MVRFWCSLCLIHPSKGVAQDNMLPVQVPSPEKLGRVAFGRASSVKPVPNRMREVVAHWLIYWHSDGKVVCLSSWSTNEVPLTLNGFLL